MLLLLVYFLCFKKDTFNNVTYSGITNSFYSGSKQLNIISGRVTLSPKKDSYIVNDDKEALKIVNGRKEERDYISTAEIFLPSPKLKSPCMFGMLSRYTDEDNYYSFAFEGLRQEKDELIGYITAKSTVKGVTKELYKKDYKVNNKKNCKLRMEVVGNELCLYINDIKELSIFDMSLPYGQVVFFSSKTNLKLLNYSTMPTLGFMKPGENNTGPTNSSILIDSKSISITKDNTVLENVNVNGYINIRANNVTIRNFKVTATPGTYYPIRIFEGYKNIVLEDGEVDGGGCSLANILGFNYTARRLNIYNAGADGLKGISSTNIEGCWVHHLGRLEGAHADGIQISRGSNFKIIGNNFDMPVNTPDTLSNAAVFIKSDLEDISNVLVESNWMNGGNYTVYSENKSRNASTKYKTDDVKIINNKFGRDFKYGIKNINDATVWKDNIWEDSQMPVN